MVRFLLHGLQSPINIGMILRVAETFRIEVLILDHHGVLAHPGSLETIGDFACGALQRRPPEVIPDIDALRVRIGSRDLVPTTVETSGDPLTDFAWRETHIIALGNEYDGLPDELVGGAASRLRIPLPEGYLPKPVSARPIDPSRTAPVARHGQPSLNVAVAAGIIAYSCHVWRVAGSACSASPN